MSCQLHKIIYKRAYQPGEPVAFGTARGYCVLEDARFVRHHAVFTAPPPPESVDPTMPF
jgi:hypothetical protein